MPSWQNVPLQADLALNDDSLVSDLSQLLEHHQQDENMVDRLRTFEDTLRAEAQHAVKQEMREAEQHFNADLSRTRARCESVVAEADAELASVAMPQPTGDQVGAQDVP